MNDLSSMILKAFGEGLLIGLIAVWPIFALIALVVVAKFIYRCYEYRRLAASGILDIDKMDGRTFEKYLEVLFKKLGYKVLRTRYVGDYGADLVTEKNGIKTIIQAKRYKGKVGVKAVHEAVAAKGYYDCTKSMVVTNSQYTKQAIKLARANGVILWDRQDLIKALLAAKPSAGSQEIDAVEETAQVWKQQMRPIAALFADKRFRQKLSSIVLTMRNGSVAKYIVFSTKKAYDYTISP